MTTKNHPVLKKPSVKKYIDVLKRLKCIPKENYDHSHNLVILACDLVRELKPIEVALITLLLPDSEVGETYYIEALDYDSMFECYYLRGVLGNPPYSHAIESGFNDDDIKKYQQIWIDNGIDPREVEGFNKCN